MASILLSKRSPNFWTSQSCFLLSNWFLGCELPFIDKPMFKILLFQAHGYQVRVRSCIQATSNACSTTILLDSWTESVSIASKSSKRKKGSAGRVTLPSHLNKLFCASFLIWCQHFMCFQTNKTPTLGRCLNLRFNLLELSISCVVQSRSDQIGRVDDCFNCPLACFSLERLWCRALINGARSAPYVAGKTNSGMTVPSAQ